jgi:hypothetical protein
MKEIQVCSNKGSGPLLRGDKIGVESFKNLVQNHWANFNQTWHKSSLGEEIQVWTNEGDYPSPRGDNCETVKIHWFFF